MAKFQKNIDLMGQANFSWGFDDATMVMESITGENHTKGKIKIEITKPINWSKIVDSEKTYNFTLPIKPGYTIIDNHVDGIEWKIISGF